MWLPTSENVEVEEVDLRGVVALLLPVDVDVHAVRPLLLRDVHGEAGHPGDEQQGEDELKQKHIYL